MPSQALEREKVCNRCGEAKPWSQYGAQTRWPDGTMRRPRWACRPCESAYTAERQRRQRRENPEPLREYARRYWHTVVKLDPERRGERRAYNREYRRRRDGIPAERHRTLRTVDAPVTLANLPVAPFREWLARQPDPYSLGVERVLYRALSGEGSFVELATVDRALLAAGDGTTLDDLYPLERVA